MRLYRERFSIDFGGPAFQRIRYVGFCEFRGAGHVPVVVAVPVGIMREKVNGGGERGDPALQGRHGGGVPALVLERVAQHLFDEGVVDGKLVTVDGQVIFHVPQRVFRVVDKEGLRIFVRVNLKRVNPTIYAFMYKTIRKNVF